MIEELSTVQVIDGLHCVITSSGRLWYPDDWAEEVIRDTISPEACALYFCDSPDFGTWYENSYSPY